MVKYNKQEKLCLLLSYLHNLSLRRLCDCIEHFGDIDNFSAKLVENKQYICDLFDETIYARLLKAVTNNVIDDIIATLEYKSLVCVTIKSSSYPKSLLNISDPPIALFCKGDISLLNEDCLAVVGTRKPMAYGCRVAEDFVSVLADYFVIVSGLAYGIDSIAHQQTLKVNGKTIAVLAGGLNTIYPASNENLANEIIAKGGLLISELPPMVKAKQYSFPKRNRIVAGLSQALLVCQAPRKSGTFSTINFALDYGRDVFVVPGEIYDEGYLGSNDIIKSLQGAMVTSPSDILQFYNIDIDHEQQSIAEVYSDDEIKVIDAINNEKQHFDVIVKSSGLNAQQVNIVLSTLQLKGVVGKVGGNVYWLTGGNK